MHRGTSSSIVNGNKNSPQRRHPMASPPGWRKFRRGNEGPNVVKLMRKVELPEPSVVSTELERTCQLTERWEFLAPSQTPPPPHRPRGRGRIPLESLPGVEERFGRNVVLGDSMKVKAW